MTAALTVLVLLAWFAGLGFAACYLMELAVRWLARLVYPERRERPQ